jgi:hypothetical protein
MPARRMLAKLPRIVSFDRVRHAGLVALGV